MYQAMKVAAKAPAINQASRLDEEEGEVLKSPAGSGSSATPPTVGKWSNIKMSALPFVSPATRSGLL